MYKYISFLVTIIFLLSCTKNDDRVDAKPVENNDPVKKNIILMIGDGMGMPQITAARTVNNDQLNMLRCRHIGIQSTHAADKYVTDSGASGTAMACGQKTNYYTVGVDVNGNPLTSILEMAESNELATGLITTSTIVHATPASFFAHHTDRFAYEDIAMQMVNKEIDFFFGGGQASFDQRTDGINLIDTLIQNNYQVVNDLSQLEGDKKAAVFIADQHPPSYLDGRGDVLSDAVEVALKRLKDNTKGFFLMVEGAQIDWAGEENDQDYLMAEMLDFDKAVGKALDFAEANGNTLIIITGDHETGGYTLVDGNIEENTVEGEFLTWLHTASMVPLFAYGPGAEDFLGVYENTEIFYKLKTYYGF